MPETGSSSTRLQAALKQAVENKETVLAKQRYQPVTATPANDPKTADKFARIAENIFYQIASSKEEGLRISEEKRQAMAKLLIYDKTKSEEENAAVTKQFVVFLEYMQEQRLALAKNNVRGQNTKVFAELKKVIDEFSRGLVDFKEGIAPFARRLEAIYNIRLSGKAVELLEEIVADRKTTDELKRLLEEQNGTLIKQADELNAKTSEFTDLSQAIKDTKREILDLDGEYRLGLSWLGQKSSARREQERRKLDLADNEERQQTLNSFITELAGSVEATKAGIQDTSAKLGAPPGTQFGALAGDKLELQVMLDISNEEHVAAHEALKERTMAYITTSEERIDAVLGNVESVNALTSETARKNGRMVILSAVMNEAVKDAQVENQKILVEFQPPADPASENEIRKAEREEKLSALNRHIKSVAIVDANATEMRNDLTREKDQFESMMATNEERIRATKHLRTSGIANMSTEMAITMTALADAANAESVHMAQTMVNAMAKTSLEIRSKEVMRQAIDMEVRNKELAAAILATDQVRKVVEIGTEAQRGHLVTLNKTLAQMTNVTASLQDTLKAGERVYAEADEIAQAELAAGQEALPAGNVTPLRKPGGVAPAPGDGLFG